jgi:hypothetical protein
MHPVFVRQRCRTHSRRDYEGLNGVKRKINRQKKAARGKRPCVRRASRPIQLCAPPSIASLCSSPPCSARAAARQHARAPSRSEPTARRRRAALHHRRRRSNDWNVPPGTVSSRVALLLRSTEVLPVADSLRPLLDTCLRRTHGWSGACGVPPGAHLVSLALCSECGFGSEPLSRY